MSTIHTEDALDQGISKYLIKIQGLIIPILLGIIGFFLVRVLLTVEGIAADNQRFNTYVITSSQRMDGLEKRVKGIEDDQRAIGKEVTAQGVHQADEWADFWKNYGYFFNVNGRPHYAKPN